MTNRFLFICGVLLVFAEVCSAQGVRFGESLKAALTSSQVSGKPVLLDAYTTWCAPCRQMEVEVFARPEVGELVSDRYEAVRLDMERGEGEEIARKYGIRAYPTIIILNAKGEEIDRAVGYLDVDAFSTFVKLVREGPLPESFASLSQAYQTGTATKSQLEKLLAFGAKSNHPETPNYLMALLNARGEWDNAEAHALVLQYLTPESSLLDTLVRYQSAYAKTLGEFIVQDRLARTLDAGLFKDEPVKRRDAKRLIRRVYTEPQADSTYIRFRMRTAREAGKAKQYGKWAIKWQDRYPTNDPEELSELIYIFDQRLPGWKTDVVDMWRKREQDLQ